MMRFRSKGKLAPRYIGPYEIVKRVGKITYKLVLPMSMECIYDVFHVLSLTKYISDPLHVLKTKEA